MFSSESMIFFKNTLRVLLIAMLILLIFCVSQGSVVTHLRGDGKLGMVPCCKFTAKSNSERIFKIVQHLSKL